MIVDPGNIVRYRIERLQELADLNCAAAAVDGGLDSPLSCDSRMRLSRNSRNS
jgi:hypothetical protein